MEDIIKYLDTLWVMEDIKIPKPTIIIYKGNRVELNNGKSVWINKRSARCAFSNMINHKLNKINSSTIRKRLEKSGLLEFREL